MSQVTRFNRHDKKQPEYLVRLRQRGVSRWRDLVFTLARPTGYPNKYYRCRSTAYDNLYSYIGFRVPRGKVFLDAGCGDSPDSLIARMDGFTKAYAVDLYPANVNSELFIPWRDDWIKMHKKHGVKFMQQDICEKLRLEDESIDVIVSSAVLDLMCEEDTLLFYKEAYRLLKPGGLLSVYIVTLKNGYGIDYIMERSKATMPGWGIEFVLKQQMAHGFIVQKPDRTN